MNVMSELLLAYYGDDFTGSTDALDALTRAGARTMLFLNPPTADQLRKRPDLQAIGIAGATRAMTPAAMEAELRPTLAALRHIGAPHVHYKVCSTFDSSPTLGSIGRAIDIGADLFDAPLVPLVVGAPPLGRYCVFGNLFARTGIATSGEIYRLDRHPTMSRHPTTLMNESDLRLHLAQQTPRKVALFDVLQYQRPSDDQRVTLQTIVGDEASVVLFDVLGAQHLAQIGALIDEYASRDHPLFSVGSSAIEMALSAHWTDQGKLSAVQDWPDMAAADRLLVVSGSCSPVTAAQIETALAAGFVEVALDAAKLSARRNFDPYIDDAVGQTASFLRERCHVIVHTRRPLAEPLAPVALEARTLGAVLGGIVRRTAEQIPLDRLCIAGGDTSSYAARALGIEALEMIAPFAPGAPLCCVVAPGSPAHGLEINVKGGQVGGPTYFVDLAGGTRQRK